MKERRKTERREMKGRGRLGNARLPLKAAAGLQKQELQSRDRLALTGGKALKGISNKCTDKGSCHVNA